MRGLAPSIQCTNRQTLVAQFATEPLRVGGWRKGYTPQAHLALEETRLTTVRAVLTSEQVISYWLSLPDPQLLAPRVAMPLERPATLFHQSPEQQQHSRSHALRSYPFLINSRASTAMSSTSSGEMVLRFSVRVSDRPMSFEALCSSVMIRLPSDDPSSPPRAETFNGMGVLGRRNQHIILPVGDGCDLHDSSNAGLR